MVKTICPDGMTYVKKRTVKYKTNGILPKANKAGASNYSTVRERVAPVCIDKKQVPNILFWALKKVVEMVPSLSGERDLHSTLSKVVEDMHDSGSTAHDLYGRDRAKSSDKFFRDFGPVIGLSYKAARAYCKLLGRRLPTEGEWANAYSNGHFSSVGKYSYNLTTSFMEYVNPGDPSMEGKTVFAHWESPIFWNAPIPELLVFNRHFRCAVEPKKDN